MQSYVFCRAIGPAHRPTPVPAPANDNWRKAVVPARLHNDGWWLEPGPVSIPAVIFTFPRAATGAMSEGESKRS